MKTHYELRSASKFKLKLTFISTLLNNIQFNGSLISLLQRNPKSSHLECNGANKSCMKFNSVHENEPRPNFEM